MTYCVLVLVYFLPLDKTQDCKIKQDTTRKSNATWQVTQIRNYTPKAEGTKEDHWRDFWVCETEAGQQVAQLLDSYMMMMMMMMMMIFSLVTFYT
jgi:hypothetical protein